MSQNPTAYVIPRSANAPYGAATHADPAGNKYLVIFTTRQNVRVPADTPTYNMFATLEEFETALSLTKLERPTSPTPPVQVPAQLTQRQLRLELLSRGIDPESVVTMLNAIPDAAARSAALIEWEYALTIDHTHPLVVSMAGALGLTDEIMDDIFIQAAKR